MRDEGVGRLREGGWRVERQAGRMTHRRTRREWVRDNAQTSSGDGDYLVARLSKVVEQSRKEKGNPNSKDAVIDCIEVGGREVLRGGEPEEIRSVLMR